MATNRPPAYQMYAKDWISSQRVRLMKDYQRGWYIQLLNEAWNSDPQGVLPDNDEDLQVLAGVSPSSFAQPSFNERWAQVKAMFVSDGEHIHNERQMEEFAKQEQRRDQASRAGKLSAQKREQSRKELQAIKDKHLNKSNDRSTTVQPNPQPTLNENPTLLLLSPSPSSVSVAQDKEVVPLFEECWKLYPKKAGKDLARRSFKKHAPHHEVVKASIVRYKAFVAQQQGDGFKDLKYMDGGTWFNNCRWEDEYEVDESKPIHKGDMI